jgi:phosphopantothenate-cysteine ligase/phosphopantothenoylcysteine decarboxylase/phosphopantothenate--cysteine ligase
MNFLVTAGATTDPIDRARAVVPSAPTRFGPVLARTAAARGHRVTLVTSDPDGAGAGGAGVDVVPYRTFADLSAALQQLVTGGNYDAVCHAAAVGSFLPAGTYTPAPDTKFNVHSRQFEAAVRDPTFHPHKSSADDDTEIEFWVRMTRTPRLIDRVRSQWDFAGLVVKFKTTAGADDDKLIETAEVSRLKSSADLIVLNTWDSARQWAFVGPVDGRYDRVARREVADRIVLSVEHMTRQARTSAEARPAPPA